VKIVSDFFDFFRQIFFTGAKLFPAFAKLGHKQGISYKKV
jgi:hypothetical protein